MKRSFLYTYFPPESSTAHHHFIFKHIYAFPACYKPTFLCKAIPVFTHQCITLLHCTILIRSLTPYLPG